MSGGAGWGNNDWLLDKPPTLAELLAKRRADREDAERAATQPAVADVTAAQSTSVADAEQQRTDEERIARFSRLTPRTKAIGVTLGVAKAGLGVAEFPLAVAKAAAQDLAGVEEPQARFAPPDPTEQRVLAAGKTAARGPGVVETVNPLPMVEGLAKGAFEGDPEALGEALGFAALGLHGATRGKAPAAETPRGEIAQRLEAVRAARLSRMDATADASPLNAATYLRRGGEASSTPMGTVGGPAIPPVERRAQPRTEPDDLNAPTILRRRVPEGAPNILRHLLDPVRNERGALVTPPGPPGTPLAPEGPPEFWSRALRAVDVAPFEKGTVAQWRAALSKGVNQQELSDIGLSQFLDAQPEGSVMSREQLREAAEPLVVHETQYGGAAPPSGLELSNRLREAREAAEDFQDALAPTQRDMRQGFDPRDLTDKINDLVRAGHTLREIREMEPDLPGRETASLVAALANVHKAERHAPAARHSQYQLPGGSNYREIVLHTPPPTAGKAAKALNAAWREEPATTPLGREFGATRRWVLRDDASQDLAEIYETEVDGNRSYAYRLFGEHEEAGRTRAALPGPAQRVQMEVEAKLSGQADIPVYENRAHWPGVKNPVGHLRVNNRTLPDGRTATHIEEFQSDVHEAGRESGYKQAPEEQAKLEQKASDATHRAGAMRVLAVQAMEGATHEADLVAGRLGRGFTPEEAVGENGEYLTGKQHEAMLSYARAVEEAVAAEGAAETAEKGVPKLPFHRTEDWLGLLVRRGLAEAVRDGSDVLTWTTGEQQAKRWSQALQRGIDEVHWEPTTRRLKFFKDGQVMTRIPAEFEHAEADQLAGIVGQDVAEQLKNGTTEPVAWSADGARVVRGTDLVVGAKGMRTFYDQITPKVVQDVLKKIGVKDAKPALLESSAAPATRTAWTGDEIAHASREADAAGDLRAGQALQRLAGQISGDEMVTRNDLVGALDGVPGYDNVMARLESRAGDGVERVSLINLEDAANYLHGVGELPDEVRRAIIRDLRELRDDELNDPELAMGEARGMHHGNVHDTWADAADVGEEYVQPLWEQALEIAREDHPPPPKSEALWTLPITPALKAKIQSGEGMYLYGGFPLDPRLAKGAGALAGAAGGAVVGAGTDKDHPLRGALIGAAVGGLGGGLIRRALDARRGRVAPAEPAATGPLPEYAAPEPRPAARPGGLPVEPPIDPSQHVNTAKFDLDPTGKVRLEAEVERVVNELGLNPKQVVTWGELRETAAKIGVDFSEGNRPTSTRMSGAQMLAVRNIVSANVAELERISGELARPDLTTPERDAAEHRLGAIEGQNAHLLDRFIRSRSAAGRDLNSLKVVANRMLDPVYWFAKAKQWKGAELTGDEQIAIRRFGETRDRAGLVQYVSGLKKAGMGAQMLTLWKAGLLTNPKTHIVNGVGNVAFGLLETAKDPIAALADRLLALRTGERTKAGISRLTMEASIRGVRQGGVNAGRVLRGEPSAAQVAKLELRPEVSYKNVIVDTYVKTVFRMLEAGDQPFYWSALMRSVAEQGVVAGKRMGLRGVKLREYVEDLQRGDGELADQIMLQAINDANVTTFKDETRLGRAAKSFAQNTPGGQIILPFQRTPGAVATRVLEYSPLGLARGMTNAIKVGLKGKGASPALQRAASEQLARGLMGTGAVWLGYQLAKHDLMTGAAPTRGSKERSLWMQENRQANSLLIGGQWVNIGRISPVGNVLALGANLYRAAQQPGANDLAVQILNVGAGALKTVADQPFLTGASQALSALQDPEQEVPQFARGLVGSVVPAAIGAVARGPDVPRDPKVGTGPFAGVMGAVAERIPGLRSKLPPKISTLGNRLPSPGWVNALFNPATASPDLRRSDPLIKELAEVGYAVPRPPRIAGESPWDYARRSKRYGVETRKAIEEAVSSQDYTDARHLELDAQAQAAQLHATPRYRDRPVALLRDALLQKWHAEDSRDKTRALVLKQAVEAERRDLKEALQ